MKNTQIIRMDDMPNGFESWHAIYPVYLNSCRTVKNGRRIPLENAVENPTVSEIIDAMTTLGFSLNKDMMKESKVWY